MVRAVMVFVLCVAVLGGAFFIAPSRVFGLPDSGDSEEVEGEETLSVPDDSVSDSPDPDETVSVGAAGTVVTPLTASLNSPYDGTISTTYVDIARDCLWNLGWFDNYVFWREGQYSYVFAYGDISLSGTTFIGDNSTILRITAPTNYSGALQVSNTEGSFTVNASNRLVYSNLGEYPQLDSRKYIYDEVMYLAMVAIGLHVLSSASRFVLRDAR